jgi:pimeloyl-ACP methyl ester carboxylesterase
VGQARITLQASDGWAIAADHYGSGPRGLVLVHGGRLTKESWEREARRFVATGYHVLAPDLRGFGKSQVRPSASVSEEHTARDVIAAVQYLRAHGAITISLIGGSMGGDAAADASWGDVGGAVDCLVLLSSAGGTAPERIRARTVLVIAARDDQRSNGDRRFPTIQAGYDRISAPKSFLALHGAAHAQAMLDTRDGEKIVEGMLRCLAAP